MAYVGVLHLAAWSCQRLPTRLPCYPYRFVNTCSLLGRPLLKPLLRLAGDLWFSYRRINGSTIYASKSAFSVIFYIPPVNFHMGSSVQERLGNPKRLRLTQKAAGGEPLAVGKRWLSEIALGGLGVGLRPSPLGYLLVLPNGGLGVEPCSPWATSWLSPQWAGRRSLRG